MQLHPSGKCPAPACPHDIPRLNTPPPPALPGGDQQPGQGCVPGQRDHLDLLRPAPDYLHEDPGRPRAWPGRPDGEAGDCGVQTQPQAAGPAAPCLRLLSAPFRMSSPRPVCVEFVRRQGVELVQPQPQPPNSPSTPCFPRHPGSQREFFAPTLRLGPGLGFSATCLAPRAPDPGRCGPPTLMTSTIPS